MMQDYIETLGSDIYEVVVANLKLNKEKDLGDLLGASGQALLAVHCGIFCNAVDLSDDESINDFLKKTQKICKELIRIHKNRQDKK